MNEKKKKNTRVKRTKRSNPRDEIADFCGHSSPF